MSSGKAQIQVFIVGQETAYAIFDGATLEHRPEEWVVTDGEGDEFHYSPYTIAEIRVIYGE